VGRRVELKRFFLQLKRGSNWISTVSQCVDQRGIDGVSTGYQRGINRVSRGISPEEGSGLGIGGINMFNENCANMLKTLGM
jgi:hypothetical protein